MFKFFFLFFFWHSAHEFEPQIPDEFKQIGQSWVEFEFIINQILLMTSTFNIQLRFQHTIVIHAAATQCPSPP